VIHRVLVWAAIACCGFVVASFALFARDELAGASQHQQNELAVGVPVTPGVTPQSTHHGQPRSFIDSAASTLTSPFKSIVQSDNQWVIHGIPTVFALLIYGVGLGYVARFSRGIS
jgi:hypothetical protein